MTNQTRHQPSIKVCNNSHLNLTIMARLQGISGGMSGRTGSFTYRQSRGQTIVSQYQPNVKNPNTQGQQNQRACFKLMSQLAAVMSPGFGTMGVTKRPGRQRPTQRNAFMQNNMPLVEVVTSADNSVTAKIQMADIKLTSSNRILGSLTATYDSGDVNGQVDNVENNVEYVQFVLVRSNAGAPPQLVALHRTARNSASQTSFSVAFESVGSGSYTLLAFGIIPTNESVTAKLNNIFNPSTSLTEAAVTLNQLVSEGAVLETETKGINVAS